MTSSLVDSDLKISPPRITLSSNLALVSGNMPYQFVLRKTRKSTGFVDFLKFQNETRIYKFLSDATTEHLKVPEIYDQIPGKALLMEYLSGTTIPDFRIPQFVSAYVEFQHQDIPVSPVLDNLNQSLRGFDYKIGGVALLTLSRQESMSLALQVLKKYREFCSQQALMTKRYWQHGDLHKRNVIVTQDDSLYFIDFENCFFTRRWPLCEIFGECIQCEEEGIIFLPELFQLYWQSLPKDSAIFQLDLALQLRFAMLRKALHVILQSKFEFRRNFYSQFLHEKLVGHAFQDWSSSVLAGVGK